MLVEELRGVIVPQARIRPPALHHALHAVPLAAVLAAHAQPIVAALKRSLGMRRRCGDFTR